MTDLGRAIKLTVFAEDLIKHARALNELTATECWQTAIDELFLAAHRAGGEHYKYDRRFTMDDAVKAMKHPDVETV